MNTSLASQITATARAFESILTLKLDFGHLVQARRVYMNELEAHKLEAEKLGNTEAVSLLSSALSDVSDAESPRLALLASEKVA